MSSLLFVIKYNNLPTTKLYYQSFIIDYLFGSDMKLNLGVDMSKINIIKVTHFSSLAFLLLLKSLLRM